jgi:phage N-6-adenine-methyltransferase
MTDFGLDPDDAEEFTAALGQIFAGSWRQIAVADRMGVPTALGLSTREWVEKRLGGYVRLSLPERREAVLELVNAGMTQREVADVLGVGVGTVNRDVPNGTTGLDLAPSDQQEPAAVVPNGTGRRLEAVYSSGEDDWSTPPDLFAELDAEFGFDLDVCASVDNAQTARHFSRDDDGLAQDWAGTCWMNPPYGDGIGDWMAKAHAHADNGDVVVCLVPARTDTAWWWDHARHGEVRFLRGRLRFGDGQATAPFPSAVVVLGRPPSVVWWER